MKNKLDLVLQPFITQVLIDLPSDLYFYSLQYLEGLLETKLSGSEKEELKNLRLMVANKGKEDTDEVPSSEDDSEKDYVEDLVTKLTPSQMKPRASVSAEAFGAWNKKSEFIPRVIPKSSSQESSIKYRLSKCFMFSSLDDTETEVIVKAMEERKYGVNEVLINQGDDGNELFVVESGKLACTKIFTPGESATFLKYYGRGDAFGELSLLYNTPRAASIQAVTEVTCFVLDRDCFNHIVKDSAAKKREKYEKILSKVEILSSVDPYEKMQLADAVQSVSFPPDDYVIRQGDWGDLLYMIYQGTAVALKSSDGMPEREVKAYKEGDYFGELSLIQGQVRAASVKATSYLKCLSLDRKAFKRILGPLQDIMKRKALEYK